MFGHHKKKRGTRRGHGFEANPGFSYNRPDSDNQKQGFAAFGEHERSRHTNSRHAQGYGHASPHQCRARSRQQERFFGGHEDNAYSHGVEGIHDERFQAQTVNDTVCPLCDKACPASAPSCGKGVRYARSRSDYNE